MSVIACDNVISKAKCATRGRGFAPSCKSSLRSPNVNNATYTLNAGGRGCSALFVLFIFFITLQSFLLNKHAAQRHVTNCFFDQTIAVNVICLSFACLLLFPTSTIVSCGGPYANSRRTPTQSVGGLATGHRRHKKKTTKTVVFFYGAVWHNLYEPVLEETAVLSAVSISFSVFTTCSFVSFRCSGLSVKL